MLFKVINSDKVKILIENDEVDKNFLNDLKFNKECAKDVLALLLINIYNETGISFLNSKVYLEVIEGTSKAYYIIITRLNDGNNDNIVVSNQSEENDMYIYNIINIENLFDAANVIDLKAIHTNTLVEYQNKYYLMLSFKDDCLKEENIKLCLQNLDGILERCKSKLLADAVLIEWGSIVDDNIIQKIKTS